MAISKKISLNQAKNDAKKLNIIVYGSIKNIEEHFTVSFNNIEKIAEYFKDVYCIIFENESTDKTRELLINWKTANNSKIKKHIILGDVLSLPTRTQRLAYCRNNILDYIFGNGLDKNYDYALHCDLDGVFWGVDIDNILTCFQYDYTEWDMMGCVNDAQTIHHEYGLIGPYYDYWALRHDASYFSKNIFSKCHYPQRDFRKHTKEFIDIIYAAQDSDNKLIPVKSCFNGLGVYKLNSLKHCRYSGIHHCGICKDNLCSFDTCPESQWLKPSEDNDHVALHRDMLNNNAKLFINTEMIVQIKP